MKTTDTYSIVPKEEQDPGEEGGRQILENMIVVYLDYDVFHDQTGISEINFNILSNHL